MAHYVDSSALAKLVVRERETGALRRWMRLHEAPVLSSDLARTELIRATRRVAPDRMAQARSVIDAVVLARITTDICELAALLEPAALRSLDAIHLATALTLGDELDGLVTYDDRLRDAASSLGIAAASPGAA